MPNLTVSNSSSRFRDKLRYGLLLPTKMVQYFLLEKKDWPMYSVFELRSIDSAHELCVLKSRIKSKIQHFYLVFLRSIVPSGEKVWFWDCVFELVCNNLFSPPHVFLSWDVSQLQLTYLYSWGNTMYRRCLCSVWLRRKGFKNCSFQSETWNKLKGCVWGNM